MTSWVESPVAQSAAEAIRASYCAEAGSGDVMCSAQGETTGVWQSILEEVLAVIKRASGHWGWAVFVFVYMTALAWVAAAGTFAVAVHLGWG